MLLRVFLGAALFAAPVSAAQAAGEAPHGETLYQGCQDCHSLDKWLTDPQAFIPGSKMFYHLDNPKDRADVIAFLKERAK